MNLSPKQDKWLDSRGGRGDDDVMEDGNGLFIAMSNGRGGSRKVYLPVEEKEDDSIN